MKTLKIHGNYSVIEYTNNLVTIDFSNDNIGLTVQSFDNKEKALEVFKNTVETLSEYKAQYHNTEIVNSIIHYNEGFYSIEPLNNDLTRIALVWNNTVKEKYSNVTTSKEIIQVKQYPKFLAETITRKDIEEVAKELANLNNVNEYSINFEYIQ